MALLNTLVIEIAASVYLEAGDEASHTIVAFVTVGMAMVLGIAEFVTILLTVANDDPGLNTAKEGSSSMNLVNLAASLHAERCTSKTSRYART